MNKWVAHTIISFKDHQKNFEIVSYPMKFVSLDKELTHSFIDYYFTKNGLTNVVIEKEGYEDETQS